MLETTKTTTCLSCLLGYNAYNYDYLQLKLHFHVIKILSSSCVGNINALPPILNTCVETKVQF